MKSISLFVDNGTYLTKVHPFTKLMYIAAAISIPLISGRLWMFGVFIAVSLLVLASGKILKKTLPLIAFSFTILLTIFLIQPEKRQCAVSGRRIEILPGRHILCSSYWSEYPKYAVVFCSICAFHKALRIC